MCPYFQHKSRQCQHSTESISATQEQRKARRSANIAPKEATNHEYHGGPQQTAPRRSRGAHPSLHLGPRQWQLPTPSLVPWAANACLRPEQLHADMEGRGGRPRGGHAGGWGGQARPGLHAAKEVARGCTGTTSWTEDRCGSAPCAAGSWASRCPS